MYRHGVVSSRQVAPDFVELSAHPLRWRLLTDLADSDYRVRELVERVGQPQNLVSYHLRLLRDSGFVTTTRSSYDGRDSYYHLDLDRCGQALAAAGAALHPALHLHLHPALPVFELAAPVTVLFVCTGNSARSPIAEALLRHHSDGRVEAISAGTRPKSAIYPTTVRVLRKEFGIDISGQRPRGLDILAGRQFDHVITLCDKAREVCPEMPRHPRRVHWSIPDPATTDDTHQGGYRAFRQTAAEIDTRVRHLLPVLAATSRKET
ncbi:MAG: ArsR family transcriptional regulator [Mycobacterium sp.]|nr:ArsR family transcriptional regulator [Mycobacterium sp.]